MSVACTVEGLQLAHVLLSNRRGDEGRRRGTRKINGIGRIQKAKSMRYMRVRRGEPDIDEDGNLLDDDENGHHAPFCEDCEVSTGSFAGMQHHFAGKKHKNMMKVLTGQRSIWGTLMVKRRARWVCSR